MACRAELLSRFVPRPAPAVPSFAGALLERMAARILVFFVRHAALVRPLNQHGRLQLAKVSCLSCVCCGVLLLPGCEGDRCLLPSVCEVALLSRARMLLAGCGTCPGGQGLKTDRQASGGPAAMSAPCHIATGNGSQHRSEKWMAACSVYTNGSL